MMFIPKAADWKDLFYRAQSNIESVQDPPKKMTKKDFGLLRLEKNLEFIYKLSEKNRFKQI